MLILEVVRGLEQKRGKHSLCCSSGGGAECLAAVWLMVATGGCKEVTDR